MRRSGGDKDWASAIKVPRTRVILVARAVRAVPGDTVNCSPVEDSKKARMAGAEQPAEAGHTTMSARRQRRRALSHNRRASP